jgi:hypothetical protein
MPVQLSMRIPIANKGLAALSRACSGTAAKGDAMLWTIVVILLILWLLGLVSSYTMGGLIHLLLVIAVIIIVVNLIQGRRSL